ncbi:MAG: dihydrofolate reductase family protein, partial [Bacteroidales bacterium]|nr:dihydrofolate reductase family protein [Bacteroidales bacterium]
MQGFAVDNEHLDVFEGGRRTKCHSIHGAHLGNNLADFVGINFAARICKTRLDVRLGSVKKFFKNRHWRCKFYGCRRIIIRHKISRVFVGSADPNPLVAGKGNQILRNHGIEVFEDCLREECDRINEIFLHYIRKKKPYVMMKYAMTLDGKIATVSGKSRWITGPAARRKVHEDRNRLAAIMVGIGTVLTDDPMLNCRLDEFEAVPSD